MLYETDETKSFGRCNEKVNLEFFFFFREKPRVVYAKKLWKMSCRIIQDRIQNESIMENLGLVICTPYYSYMSTSRCLLLASVTV